MNTSQHASPGSNLVRKAWIGLTFLILAVPVLIGALVGALVGLVQGLRNPKLLGLEFRAGFLNGAIRVTQLILPFSSKVYTALFARHLYLQDPLPRLSKDFLIVGHRGAPTTHCENTIESFAEAIRQGANALEIDLCFTQDGEVVVWHDWNPAELVATLRESGFEEGQAFRPDFGDPDFRKRSTGLTLAELRARYSLVPRTPQTPSPAKRPYISTFREFVQWAMTQRPLKAVFLDIKLPADELEVVAPFMQAILRDLSQLAPQFECIAMTTSREVYHRMQEAAPSFKYCFDVELRSLFMGNAAGTAAEGSTMIPAESMKNHYCSVGRPTYLLLAPFEVYREVVLHDIRYRQQKQLDIRFIAWTINHPEEQKWLVSAGVDGILTDLPGLLAKQNIHRRSRYFLSTPFRMLRQKS